MASPFLRLAWWAKIPAPVLRHHDDFGCIRVMVVVVVVRCDRCSCCRSDTGTDNSAFLTADLGTYGTAERAADRSANRRVLHDLIVVVGKAWFGEHATENEQQSEQDIPTHTCLLPNRRTAV